MTVEAFNTTTAARFTNITCSADGVPRDYKFTNWTFSWPGHPSVLKLFPGSSVLRLEALTYEYSGVYACTVKNGVMSSKNHNAGIGSDYLKVEGIINSTVSLNYTSNDMIYLTY